MMRQFIFLIILLCSVVGCQMTQDSKLTSSWEKLKNAKSISCKDWPGSQEELEITEIYPVDMVKSANFIVSGRSRDGSYFNYVLPLRGKKVDHSKKVPLKWGFGSEFLGSVAVKGDIGILIEAAQKSGKKRLEIRDLETNVIRYASTERNPNFRSQMMIPDNNGFWLAYKLEKSEESMDDQPFQFVRFEWTDKQELRLVGSPKFSPVGDIKLLSLPDEKVLGIMLDTGTSDKQKPANFRYFILEKGQPKPNMKTLSVDISERVESWSVARNAAGIVLAYVTGDTLLWENASLQIVRLDDRAAVVHRQGFEINHEHVGDPLLVPAGAGIYLFVSKWLDAESTVAVYRITTSDIEDQGIYGVFQEGTFLQNAFYAAESNSVLLMTQAPAGYTRSHSYCIYNL
ncbi:MAG: hypothetical protein ACOH5I_04990 [Oligoflexus sp.]